jgi:hypothetical protein
MRMRPVAFMVFSFDFVFAYTSTEEAAARDRPETLR